MAAAAILKNRKIAIFWPRFMRFRQNLTRCRSSTFLTCSTVKNLKIQDGGGCHLVKIQKSRYLNCGSIWRNDAVWCSWPFWPLKILNFENQDGGGRYLEKLKSIYRLATGISHAIWDHTVLHATRQWWESCLFLYVEATWWVQCWRGLLTTNFSYKSYMLL